MDASEVKLTWTYPVDDNDATITSFRILILDKQTSLYTENQSVCNGSSGVLFSCNV